MDFLRNQVNYIGGQLKTMSLSSRLVIGLLLVVLLVGFYEMTRWASRPEWTPLLDQSLKTEEIQRIAAEMSLIGIESRVEGDRVMIRGAVDERQRAQAVLAQRGAMPRDTSLSYQSLIEQSSHFISNQESAWRQDRGLETELSAVLRKFQGILDADVFLEKPRKRPLGRRVDARASVHVKLADDPTAGGLGPKQIAAIANFVAGAVEGLAPADVKITDGQRFYHAPDAAGQIPHTLLEQQRAQEEWFTRKIYDQFSYIDGLVVNVHAKLRDIDERVEQTRLGKPVVSEETTELRETKSGAQAAGPGVLPNQGRAITDPASGGPSTLEEKSTVVMSPDRDVHRTIQTKSAGHLDELWASISVPHGYLETLVRNEQGIDPASPVAHAQLVALAPKEMSRLRSMVKTLIGAQSEDQVAVDWYYDSGPSGPSGEPAQAGQLPSFVTLAEQYGPRALLGLLALVSLLAVLRIARKAQSTVAETRKAVSQAIGAAGASADRLQLASLGGGPLTVGEAEGMHSALVGHEVDEGLVRTQQIVEQIGQLVKDDPESAAGIVQNWLADEQ